MTETDGAYNNRYNENTFHSLLEHSNDGIVILSLKGYPVYASPSVKNILGYTEEELMKTNITDLAHPDDIVPMLKILEQVLANPGVAIKGHTGRMLHKDGSWRWIEAMVTNLLHDPFIGGIVDNFRDITEQKEKEEQLIKAKQLYSFISQINQAIVHYSTQEELFKAACDIAIKFGHFKVAWIGLFDIPNRQITLVNQSGMYPEDIPNFTNTRYETTGLQGQVLQTGTYHMCNDIQNDLHLEDWRRYAQKRVYNSAMVLPIKKGGKVFGTFNVYASVCDFFKKEEIALLLEATGDISYAIDVFENNKLRIETVRDLQESESNLNAIIENTDASIYSLDRELCYITFNRSLRDSLKDVYGLEIHPGDKVYAFLEKIDPEEARGWEIIYAKALSGEVVKFEKEYTVGDFYSCISFAIYPIEDKKNIIGLSCFAIDITNQKKDSIQKEKMLSDIVKRNTNLEQFSYIVSHNLRSPLTTIIGLTNLLAAYEFNKEELVLIDGISTSVKKLDEIIHDLNHVLKINNPINENKTIVKLSDLLSDIKFSLRDLLKNDEVKITSNFSPVDEILTLRSYLYSIFLNLISNSIKYKQAGIKPVIKIATEKKGKTIELIFNDNGIGIDLVSNADKVFGLYNRFHNHTEGKGMGLYMVKAQVEVLGGTITIDSEVNKGTTFKIVFQSV